MKIHALWLSASVLALGWAGAGTAQAAANDAASPTLSEVVVTAERRSEDLQKTAISAVVMTGGELTKKNVLTVDQLQFIAPAVTVNNFGQGIDFNVRGIGKAEHNTQTTTGVITYRDGVPTFPGYITEEPYYDISSIEVLRGPQGTFAGQNATGGAVFVTTNNPVIGGGYHGYAQGQAGEYSDFGLQGAVNLPVSDTFAARVALFGESRNSFYHFTTTGGAPYTGNPGKMRWAAGRISLLWRPSEDLSFLLKSDFDYLDNGAYPADPVLATNDPFHLTANAPQRALDRFNRTSLKIDYGRSDGIKLRSISAYQFGSTAYKADLDGTATGGFPGIGNTFADAVDERIYSQEINIISPDQGMVTWILGGFAQSDRYHFLEPYVFVVGTPPGFVGGEYRLQGTNPKTNYAAFGQISLNLPHGLQLQAGGRYSADKTTNHVQILQYGLPLVDEQTAKFTNFSYKLSANWTVNPDNFLYAFMATGYRPGGLNVPVGLGIPAPFIEEKIRSYEVGWKSTMMDGHLRTQVAAFYNNYKNFQVIIGYPAFPVFGFELNVPDTTRIYGFEVSGQAVFGQLSLDAGLGFMHSELGSFFATDPRQASFLPCDPVTGPASVSCVDLKGKDQTYAPNFTFNVGAQYDIPVGNGDTLTPRINYGHVSPQWATLFENTARGDRLTERNILGAQLAWTHGDFVATLYGTNITDQHYIGAINTSLRFMGPPRQVGVRLLKLF